MGLAEKAVAQGRWLILAFHALGDGRLGAMTFDFVELIDHLTRGQERIWIAPVREVAQWIVERREALS